MKARFIRDCGARFFIWQMTGGGAALKAVEIAGLPPFRRKVCSKPRLKLAPGKAFRYKSFSDSTKRS
jgi:hypothetical protein